jgi:hypothetical protein
MRVAAWLLAIAVSAAPAATSDRHATVRDFASKHFKNPAWGYSHSMRDYALARELAAADHVTPAPAGRARVAQRKAELEGYLKDLRRESENFRTL